jgi:hypothetical protein
MGGRRWSAVMAAALALGLAMPAEASRDGLGEGRVRVVVPVEVPAPVKSAGKAVRFNGEVLRHLAAGTEVELELPGGARHLYLHESSIEHGGGLSTWIARSPISGDNERAIVTHGPQGAFGWMKTADGEYHIRPSGRGYDLLALREPDDHTPKFGGSDAVPGAPDAPGIEKLKGQPTLAPGGVHKSLSAKVTPTPVVQIDVMLIYTRDLAQKVGPAGVMPMLYNTIATLNQILADSEVAISARLVYAALIDYPNGDYPSLFGTPGTLAAMEGLLGNASYFQALTWGPGSIRDTVGADFVALLRDGPTDTGGMARILRNPVTYPTSTVTESAAYSVNNGCRLGCGGLLAHEMGHNMGNMHDPATDGDGTTTLYPGVFPYSFGYYSCANGLTCNPWVSGGCTGISKGCANAVPNDFGDVMSYFGPKVFKYSNALLSNCVPPGGNVGTPRACGGAFPAPAPPSSSNLALSMNNARGALSAYRNQTIASLPGSVQFTASEYSGSEGATLTFTVTRMGGTSGTLSVGYTVSAGSASAGTDFTLASGTLTWINGDGANKTVTVTLAADTIAEGFETVTATLAAPTGALGAYLGYPSVATGYIVESINWPQGTTGGFPSSPAGWVGPPSPVSSVNWAIATDSVSPSDSDGRSFKSGEINYAGPHSCTNPTWGFAVPCPSATELTNTFPAGVVSFAYKVSAYPEYGFLEFLVDGAVVLRVTGIDTNPAADTGWRNFSTVITAGTHTLRWQYRPGFNFQCRFAGGPPSLPDCADRAWIDSLKLPGVDPPPPMVNQAIVFGPAPANVTVGGTGTVSATGGGSGNPVVFASLTASTCSVSGATVTGVAVGTCTVSANQAGNAGYNAAPQVTQSFAILAAPSPARMSNISTRMQVLTGNDVMIGGFVIGGAGTKRVAIVATGPSLSAFGIATPLANPTLRLVRSSDQVVLATNDNWQTASNAAQLTAAGFAPSHGLEAAILVDLPPGAYTAVVEGASGGTGVAVVAVYEVDQPGIPLVNISTRGRVLTGNDVMIGGFVITGSASQAVAIVATGPSLSAFGIANPLPNPTLRLVRSSDQLVIATNDNWSSGVNAAQLASAGFAPNHPLEAGIYAILPPGAYTAIVEGVGGGTGVSVIGVYRVN